MPSYISLRDLTVATPDGTPLLSNLTQTYGPGLHGLVGRNGCGKSSLLAVVAGDHPPASGSVAVSGKAHLVAQTPPGGPVADAMGIGPDLAAVTRLLTGTGTVADAAEADWTLPDRVAEALNTVGLGDLAPDGPTEGLSGGERMRLGLAGALLSGAEVLLLDEPTNNMDAVGCALVEAVMRDWPGPVLVASHDRALLEHMDTITDLDSPGAEVTQGGWSVFEAERAARLARAEAEAQRTEAELARAQRERQAQREKQEQKRAKGRAERRTGSMPKEWHDRQEDRAGRTQGKGEAMRENRIAQAEAAQEGAQQALSRIIPRRIDLPPSHLPQGKDLLELRDVAIRRGGRTIGPVSLRLTGPERIALAGDNGTGKTTLMRLIAGDIAADRGQVDLRVGRIAWLDQDLTRLDDSGSLIAAVQARRRDLTEHDIRATLARYGFRNRDSDKPVAGLSGGERLRAGLLIAFAGSPAPELLLLDEPTNHLDLEAIRQLETALNGYDGALIVVSHDRRFLQEIGVSRRIELEKDGSAREEVI